MRLRWCDGIQLLRIGVAVDYVGAVHPSGIVAQNRYQRG